MTGAQTILFPSVIIIAIVMFVIAVFGYGAENNLILAHDVRVVLPDRMRFFSDAVLDGRLPLWNPHTFSGSPFLANPATAVFYPTTLLFVGLPASIAIVLQLIVHLLFGAWGMYLLARRTYRLSGAASLFAAMLFAMSGRIVGHGFAGHTNLLIAAAYIPMLAYVVDRATVSFNVPQTRGASFIARFGPWPWLAGLMIGLQVLSGGLPFVWLGLLFVGLLRLGQLLSEPQRFDWRAWSREASVLAWIALLGLLVAAVQLAPSFEFAQASDRPRNWQYASGASFHPRMFAMMFNPRAVLEGKDFFWEFYGYIGLLPLALAIAGLGLIRRNRKIFVLTGVALLAVMFMFGKFFILYPLLWKYVPTFDIFRAPARAMVLVHLIIALLAAFGVDRIAAWMRDTRGVSERAISVLIILLFIATWLDIVGAARWYERWLFTPVNKDLIWSFDSESPAVTESRKRHVEILQQDTSWYRFWFDPVHLRRNYSFENGGYSVGGYDLMMLERYSHFLHFMTFNPIDQGYTFPEPLIFKPPAAFPLKVLGVKYMDHAGRLVEQIDFPIRRAWFATRELRVADEIEALERMRQADFERFDDVVIEADPAGSFERLPISAEQSRSVAVKVSDVTPERLVIEIAPHLEGYVVLSEAFYPGWHAERDGAELPLVRCNSILRCVRLPASEKSEIIEIFFRPATLIYGGLVSLIALLIIGAALATVIRRNPAQTPG